MDKPCRSCAKFVEGKVEMHKDCLGGSCSGVCSDGVDLNSAEFLTYGVDTEPQGKKLCTKYDHAGFPW